MNTKCVTFSKQNARECMCECNTQIQLPHLFLTLAARQSMQRERQTKHLFASLLLLLFHACTISIHNTHMHAPIESSASNTTSHIFVQNEWVKSNVNAYEITRIDFAIYLQSLEKIKKIEYVCALRHVVSNSFISPK